MSMFMIDLYIMIIFTCMCTHIYIIVFLPSKAVPGFLSVTHTCIYIIFSDQMLFAHV